MTGNLDRVPQGCAKEPDATTSLDLRGLKCPLPVLRAQKALARARGGSAWHVLADDPLARLDITHLCRERGHELLRVEALDGGGWRFEIRAAG